MIKTIFILIILYYIIKYIVSHLRIIKTDNKEENPINFWMFTYDFKDKKKQSIFDKDPKEVLEFRQKKNKLILFLYISIIIAFFLVNSLLAQILLLILN